MDEYPEPVFLRQTFDDILSSFNPVSKDMPLFAGPRQEGQSAPDETNAVVIDTAAKAMMSVLFIFSSFKLTRRKSNPDYYTTFRESISNLV
jgi:hypothetical protein